MHTPDLLEKVRLAGFDEVYLVTRVDREMQVADLLPIVYGKRPLWAVPFVALESTPDPGPLGLRPC